jgi:pyruvate dehydrogenase E2 component (dihydrolipoamide acetyltransferase)
MAVKVEMPKLSDTMEEGVIAAWNVEEGDTVESGDVIAEVETDKATMEVEVFDAGTILKIVVDEGDAVPLGGLIAVIGEEGEDISDILEEAKSESDSEESSDKSDKEEQETDKEEDEGEDSFDPVFGDLDKKGNGQPDDGRIKASPLARNMAEKQGIKLANVQGSGPHGRIIKRDIESYEPSKTPAAAPVATVSREDKEHRVSQMRKTIARRLSESKFSSPHYYETIDIDMSAVWDARKQLNEISETKISFNDIVVKACATALRQHPDINSSWQGDKIIEHGDVNVAVAVGIEEGLVTPVINNTDQKGLQQIAAEGKELIEKAQNRNLQPEEMEGSTFTVSNLGMFGIEEFTAIINPPNASILAVGAIRDEPVVEDGEVVPGKRMKVTLSSDHRIVDGVSAAKFLNTLKRMLENPLGMVL